MPDFLAELLSSNGFMPHGHCYLWRPGLVWLHVISDLLVALSYTSIPFTLVYFVRKRRDIPFNWMFLCFGMFIIACGATHYMEIWTLWTPTYWLSGVIKAITAAASVPTAILLIRLIPKALAIPTPEQLRIAHDELRRAHEVLEQRVRERTAELTEKNDELAKEIVERKEAQAAIERLRAEREADLHVSIQVRDDFIAIAGHELKTPLTAMLMQIQSLQRALRKGAIADTPERLEKAANSGLRLERLINQLLDVSRITAGRLHLEPETMNLVELVREIVGRVSEASTKPKPEITVSTSGPVVGNWDRLRLDQLITNLLGNALKYGQKKPVELTVGVEDEMAVVTVTDHGIGIDPEHQKKIFQRFERAVATRDFGGFGLGLWIATQIVEASGGAITVRSTPGEGASFTVRLPMTAGAPSA